MKTRIVNSLFAAAVSTSVAAALLAAPVVASAAPFTQPIADAGLSAQLLTDAVPFTQPRSHSAVHNFAQTTDNTGDSSLTQTVTSDEINADEAAVVSVGHVDLGPRIVDGNWRALARDDSGKQPVWRPLSKTVLAVTDDALLAAPTSKEFAFMGGREGDNWWVVPQTENPRALWLGWNTQDPAVTKSVERGVTMRLGPVEGPGKTWLFLQNGTFGEPVLLFDGQQDKQQDVWVDVNTHVHANWVFTEPGVYLVGVQFVAATVDGEDLVSSDVLRFAVGSQDPKAALTADASAVESRMKQAVAQQDAEQPISASSANTSEHDTQNTNAAQQASTEPATEAAAQTRILVAIVVALVAACTVTLGALAWQRRKHPTFSEANPEA